MDGDIGGGFSVMLGVGTFFGLRYLLGRWRPGPISPLPAITMGLISFSVVLGSYALYEAWLHSGGLRAG